MSREKLEVLNDCDCAASTSGRLIETAGGRENANGRIDARAEVKKSSTRQCKHRREGGNSWGSKGVQPEGRELRLVCEALT